MKYITLIIIFLSLPIFLMAGSGDEGIIYTIKPELKERDVNNQALYSLSVEGTTNLPDEAILDITFTYQFPGSDNERYLDYKRCSVTASAYDTRLGPFKRKPPAGLYLFKVTFDPARQPDSVSKYLESKYK